MTIVLTVAVLSILTYIGWKITTRYLLAVGTPLERLWIAVQGSATVAVSYVSGAALAAVALLDEVPEFRDQIQAIVPDDKWKYVSLVIIVVTYVARRRTL